jgi:hypothetical protein
VIDTNPATMPRDELERIVNACATAIIGSTRLYDEAGRSVASADEYYRVEDLSAASMQVVRDLVDGVMAGARAEGLAWRKYWSLSDFGCDIAMTVARRGIGFWDRASPVFDAGRVGARLTTICHAYNYEAWGDAPADDGDLPEGATFTIY